MGINILIPKKVFLTYLGLLYLPEKAPNFDIFTHEATISAKIVLFYHALVIQFLSIAIINSGVYTYNNTKTIFSTYLGLFYLPEKNLFMIEVLTHLRAITTIFAKFAFFTMHLLYKQKINH